jgi:hypothetical protein
MSNPAFIAALPSILDSLFNLAELAFRQAGNQGELPEDFIAARTQVRQQLMNRAEAATAPQQATSASDATGQEPGGHGNGG